MNSLIYQIPIYQFQNGHLQITEEFKKTKELEIADNFLDRIHVGKISSFEELNSIPKYMKGKSHPQKVTDFNLWSPFLSIAEMKIWTSCK